MSYETDLQTDFRNDSFAQESESSSDLESPADFKMLDWSAKDSVRYLVGKTILDYSDSYKGAIKLRREIWNMA